MKTYILIAREEAANDKIRFFWQQKEWFSIAMKMCDLLGIADLNDATRHAEEIGEQLAAEKLLQAHSVRG